MATAERTVRSWIALALAGAVWGCGAGEELPPPGTPADPGGVVAPPVAGEVAQPAAARPAAPAGAPAAQAGVGPPPGETQLVREVFSYQGSGRDPFKSGIASGEARPLFEDLRVASVNFDPRYPTNSVAVLRDESANKRYTVRVGDALGRMRITAIRQYEVVVVISEFGRERQETLRLTRREGIP